MKRIVLLALVALLVTAFTVPALAADLPRVMIVGEDADPDTVPRNSRVFKRVLNAISNELLDEGFDVKDETALTVDTHIQGRSRRNDAELITIAKDAGIDVLFIFSVYPNMKSTASGKRATARVEGRLLKVYTGSRMGNFEHEPQRDVPLSNPVTRSSLLEDLGKISKEVGREVGSALAKRLSAYVDQPGGDTTEWTLRFEGFNDDQMMDWEAYLQKFSGYDRHSVKKNALNTSSTHNFFYYSSIDSAKLKRNFARAAKKLGMNIRIHMKGTSVTIMNRKGLRKRKAMGGGSW